MEQSNKQKTTGEHTSITLFLVILSILISCTKCSDCCLDEPSVHIYKLRGDYINNVCVRLTNDKSEIHNYPGPTDNCGNPLKKPIEVNDGYFLDFCCDYGVNNTAYLSVSKSDYQDLYPINSDSMYNLILDKDPFVEYYVDEAQVLYPGGSFAFDTVLLNSIISNNEMDEYFTRLK
jgi:hypothetical protein